MKNKKNEIVAAAEAGGMVANSDHLMRRILTVRGRSVMVDRDLAELYKVPTKRLNEQVKRNSERFPERFMFRLSADEMKELVANCDRFAAMKHSSVAMYAFTEQGVAMLATVLRSEVAVRASIDIMDAFVATTPSCTTWVRQSTALGGASRPTRPATRRKSPRFWRRSDERRDSHF